MSKVQKEQEAIEQKIDELEKEGRVVDVKKTRLPNGDTLTMRIQHSGQPFTVYFTGKTCKVGVDDSNDLPHELKWEQGDVVEKVVGYIEQLISTQNTGYGKG